MKKQQKSILVLVIITVFMATALFLPGLVSAGDLEPSGPPTTGTMHTLDEIYNKLDQLVPGGGLAPVEITGQTICYDASGTVISCVDTGQDGEIEAGVLWPNPRFTDNGDGTVTDNLTGLIWLKDANRFATKIWTEALTACNELADDGAGLTDSSAAGDWRLPNVKELQSLIHYGVYDPALPDTLGTGQWTTTDPFINVQFSGYWSSTTYENITVGAWGVHMGDGSVDGDAKDSSRDVWPVRGGN